MKKLPVSFYVSLAITIFAIYMLFDSWIDYKRAHKEDVSSFTSNQDNDISNTQGTTDLSQLKSIVISDFFKQQTHTHNLSNQLKSRIQAGEFNSVWDQEYEIYDIHVYSQKDFGDVQIAYIDVVLERNQKYQWIQFKTTWNKDQLLDIAYQDINYLDRINETSGYIEAVTFTKGVLESLTELDQSHFGWKLQDSNPMANQLLNIQVKSLDSIGIYTPQTKPEDLEVLLTATYQVYSEEIQNKEVQAFLYVKRYDGKWQLENIHILDIGELQ